MPFLTAIIISLAIILILYFLVDKKIINLGPNIYIFDYFGSFIIFSFFSSVSLLLYPFVVNFFVNKNNNEFLEICNELGVTSVIVALVIAYINEIIYKIIVCAITRYYNKKHNGQGNMPQTFYELEANEKNTLYIFFCTLLFLYYILLKLNIYAGPYFVLILGKLFWLRPRVKDVISIIESIKSLSAMFWGSILYFIVIASFYIHYQNKNQTLPFLGMAGLALGTLFAIFIVGVINKHKNSDPLHKE